MKISFKILIFILIAAGFFLAGSWVTFQGVRNKATTERKILHYVDPMNPALKSDKPGIAPCGMPLEPVYADQDETAAGEADLRASMPPGTVRVSPEKQQLIGVKMMTIEKAPWSHTIRVLGRVTPDERLVYRINAATDGWIEEIFTVTTGSLVKKNEMLATLSFFSLEYRTLVQNYFNLFNLGQSSADLDSLVNNPQYSAQQLRQMRKAARSAGDIADNSQIDYYRKYLYNYGIGPYQLDEMERTRKFPEAIEIRAPAAGFIVFRNVSPGLRIDRGAELFRIADLSRIWIEVDLFETEASYFKPGMRVRMELPYQKKTLYAKASSILPQFDPDSRTLKVRLEAGNPGYVMRPDMFVDVELPMTGEPAIIVPAGAVLDSGLKKTVFVDRGNGYFEPRHVETGRSLGERVEIISGLTHGEKIVVSGNFLIDSEARIQQAAAGITGKVGRDPVCGMNIDEDRARAEGNFLEYKGRTYFFCEPEGREDFRKDPERYLKDSPEAKKEIQSPAPMPGEKTGAMSPPTSGNKAPMTPGQGSGKAMPGMQGPAPISSQMPGGMVPPASGNPVPIMPGQGTGMAMPGAQEGTSVPQPAGDSNSSPEATTGMTGGQIDAAGNGYEHD